MNPHLAMERDALAEFLRRDFAQVAADFQIVEVGIHELQLRLVVAPRHLRPGGTVSGPAIFALADVAMYLAILSRIGPVELAVTTNCSIDFLRKPQAGTPLVARARILKLGRRLAVGDVLIFSEGGRDPVARAALTYSIPPPQEDAARHQLPERSNGGR